MLPAVIAVSEDPHDSVLQRTGSYRASRQATSYQGSSKDMYLMYSNPDPLK